MTRRAALGALAVAALATTLTPMRLAAQCRPSKDSNEAKLLAFFAAPIAFSPGGVMHRLPPGGVQLTVEATYVPAPGHGIRRTGVCFQEKSEDTHLSPLFPRPRLAVGLPGGLVVEASYLPPVDVADAQANLGSLALSRARTLDRFAGGGSIDMLLRVHGTVGRVRGAITCSRRNLQLERPADPCFGSLPSRDTYRPNMVGGEIAVAVAPSSARWRWYGGAGASRLTPRFQVGFQSGLGTRDSTRIEVDLNRIAAFAGGDLRISTLATVAGELYSVPVDVTTFRLAASVKVR